MTVRSWAPVGARLRARACARAAGQSGEALIEVLITALLIALVSGAILTAYAQVSHLSGNQRQRVEAAALAAQNAAQLRGLTITQLSGLPGNQQWPSQVIDGTTYTVTSSARFISGASSGAACTTGPTVSTADEVQTTSTVTWAGDGGAPVVVHGLVTPNEGGSVVMTAVDATGTTGLAGVTATLTGPTTVSPLTTDQNGCAVFGGLDGGAYTVAFSDPGYVDVNGNSPPPNQSVTVVPTETAKTQELQLGRPGTIAASFVTTYQLGATGPTGTAGTSGDQFVAVNSGMTSGYRVLGTLGSYGSNVSSGQTMFPFASNYVAYAGGCNDTPPAAGQATAAVSSNGTASVVLPEPALIVLPMTEATTEYDDRSAAISYSTGSLAWTQASNAGDYAGTESDASAVASTATFTVPAGSTSAQVVATTASGEGIATVGVNGVVQQSVDLYSSTTKRQQLVGTPVAVSGGATVTVTVTGTHDASSSGNKIALDAIVVAGTPTLMTTRPDVTITDTDAACGSREERPATQVPTSNQGALVSPGQPWGNYTVCVDNGSNYNTATVANTNYGAGNTVTIPLYSGAPGYGSGTCT